MDWFAPASDPDTPVGQFHLLDCVDYSTLLTLQQRLVWDASESQGRRITVLSTLR